MAIQDDGVKIIGVKASRPKTPDQVQVMLHVYLPPMARPKCQGCVVTGQVVYCDHMVDIPA